MASREQSRKKELREEEEMLKRWVEEFKKGHKFYIEDWREDEYPDAPLFIWYTARSGEVFRFDISRNSLASFGFFHGQRVNTVKGHATVVGLRTKYWWVHLDSDKGCSYWDNYANYDTLIQHDVYLLPQNYSVEEEVIHIRDKLPLSITEQPDSETYFILSTEWFTTWKAHVEYHSKSETEQRYHWLEIPKFPGKIDNRALFSVLQTPSLRELCIYNLAKHGVPLKTSQNSLNEFDQTFVKQMKESGLFRRWDNYRFIYKKFFWQLQLKGLLEGDDYVIVSERMWRILITKYGGGPSFTIEKECEINYESKDKSLNLM